ncbi:hypothetical protein GGR55DRAFT_311175 [Xylaria sp. FL0064]|nr:hypothetical protein GGR55DRAFT_311175 [Xylaria sp. FL0064]
MALCCDSSDEAIHLLLLSAEGPVCQCEPHQQPDRDPHLLAQTRTDVCTRLPAPPPLTGRELAHSNTTGQRTRDASRTAAGWTGSSRKASASAACICTVPTCHRDSGQQNETAESAPSRLDPHHEFPNLPATRPLLLLLPLLLLAYLMTLRDIDERASVQPHSLGDGVERSFGQGANLFARCFFYPLLLRTTALPRIQNRPIARPVANSIHSGRTCL